MTEGLPPVRELMPFDDAQLEPTSETRTRVVVEGTSPGTMAQYEVEPKDELGIPEPEWLRVEVVGYHWGDYRPPPVPYRAEGEVDLPPGCIGVEVIGKDRTERLPLIFNDAS